MRISTQLIKLIEEVMETPNVNLDTRKGGILDRVWSMHPDDTREIAGIAEACIAILKIKAR